MADSSFTPRNILIFGATGTIGSFITKSIVSARSEFNRVAIFTTAPAAGSAKEQFIQELKTKNVGIIVGDIASESDVTNAYKGIDTVVAALGRGVIDSQILLIKLAASSDSVKWYFPSEYGTDIKYGPASATEKPHQQKLKVRAYLEGDEEIQKSGLKYTYVVTGPFADGYLRLLGSPEAGGWDVKTKTAWLLEKNNKVSLTTMKDTGELVLAALRHPTASFNKALKVNSFTTSPAQVQEEFERQTGGSWTVHEASLARVREVEEEAWAANLPFATGITLRRIWAEGGTLYEKRDNDVIGEPKLQTLGEIVSENVKRSA
ncbi:uncharacterized protein TRUGW13939_03335 [Talaromyces rugulosus]|uniref:NmrA-like domain-containing protein n=1 Tax=Talaromyces rugulosus TaxID=121627 RepID=A0A7H8QQI6_TALRU|nr:uncharacterized protein TRUGW13939_03335 [Talaromyces rugulosus]QKX56234.1 hypothetical protein TRUGW13939_03335 [Talaromyces rugulosus]